uniref:Zinc finger protein 839 n=1 Tax=Paramormyrops kingsleyae TaxID=1676925 RepID=A0A3B3S703_9TELE|nr:zinc finger protein 839 [Paramormyrops kingsleyae]XP_023654833.1 zinc finger protein 839 [Paramormyrops kingsleyae]
MADKQNERNTKNGSENVGCDSTLELHEGAKLMLGRSFVLTPNAIEKKDIAENRCVEVTVKDVTDTSDILEYLQTSAHEGTDLESDYQVINQYTDVKQLLNRNIATSFVETPGTGTTNYTAMSSEIVNTVLPETTTIIYVQPDGSFVEGTGLTAEEQQQLVEQLEKQPFCAITESETPCVSERPPARLAHCGRLAPKELQQVIQQVSRSQKSAMHVEQHIVPSATQCRKPAAPATAEQTTAYFAIEPASLFTAESQTNVTVQPQRQQQLAIMQNASQQLQNVAKQVALQQSQSQNGTQLRKLEPIQIQVQVSPTQEGKERSVAPLAVFQQTHMSVNQLNRKVNVSSGVNVTCPQIIHISPVVGEQQYILHNAGDAPIQLLLQRPEPITGSVLPISQKIPLQTPIKAVVADPLHSKMTMDPTLAKKERQREKNNQKRPQKIKTRSGRVSRPPKYKVKDYKFIKREDLADGHQSDSDDYSEISVEEEEDEEGKVSVAINNFNLNPKAFKCETCEKAYIGNGGLSRHYRLNPTHRTALCSQEPVSAPRQQNTVSKVSSGDAPSMIPSLKNTNSETALVPATAGQMVDTAFPSTAQVSSPEKALAPQNEQKSESINPERALTCTEQKLSSGPGRPKGPGRPGRPKIAAHRTRRGRPGRPPKHFGGSSMEQKTQRNKTRLKEVLQQCNNEELVEMVLPRLAKVMTVWEFLLMKVEKGCPSKPHFSDVYREFEQLHRQVKKMAQDHFGIHNDPGPLADVELTDPQEFKTLPPAKRFKLEKATIESNGVCLNENMIPDVAVDELSGAPEKDTDLAMNGFLTPALEAKASVIHNHLEIKKANTGERLTVTESKESQLQVMDPQQAQMIETQMETETPKPEVVFTTFETDFTEEVLVEEHLPSTTETENPSSKIDNSSVNTSPPQLISVVTEKGQSGLDMDTSEVLNESDVAAHMSHLQQTLSTDVIPLDHSYRSNDQEPQQPTETVNGLEQDCSLGSSISLGGTVEFQLAEASQKHDHEQILIHTENGLIMQHSEGSLASDRIVIVTDSSGTTMHIRAPEEVPLETVQALLGIENGQTEGILVPETHH